MKKFLLLKILHSQIMQAFFIIEHYKASNTDTFVFPEI